MVACATGVYSRRTMALDSKQRRSLAARGNRLPPKLTIGGEEPPPATVEHVRRAFARDDLIKVRIITDDRDAFGLIVAWLAERVPCEVVQRVGRVALLYRPRPDATAESRDAVGGFDRG